MSAWLITNATLVNEGRRFEADLRVRDDRIEQIGGGLSARPGERVYDASGLWLLPGVIDAQVHFREPGMEHKGDLATEPAAAVAGGVTSYLEMPNTRPPTLDDDALEDKYRRAAGRSRANFGFYYGASNDNLEAIKRLDPRATPGVKVFMGASTGNMLVDDPAILEGIFRECRVPIITHCEDTPMIDAEMAKARAKYGEDIPVELHAEIRSRAACLKSTELALSLARRFGSRLHVLHISTAEELALFAPGPVEGKRITAETCVHFLRFAREDYATRGTLIKCNPSIKEASDRAALLRAVAEDRIDVLATDHAPHTLDEKRQKYEKAPSGLPLVQDFVVAALECVHEGHFPLEQLVRKFCHAPAIRFDIAGRGFLREGYHADLTLIDPAGGTEVTRGRVLSKCGWSPFEGVRFRSRVAATFVNGELAFDGETLLGAPQGRRLEFAR
ncbi:dihydroorotase [Rehaibacterium terrae]|jgi:dihydroorotase|uniref:Dihydroorotase n=1 Tax=Rehaibacterium terrae TaxID=1341696 RepID=A0A7W8DFD6_9GAMM|nr:dihydroorotase [Rehaibacterium terrae]MBB5016291.1 dihydroorotase [Rehaibacterium terrae]